MIIKDSSSVSCMKNVPVWKIIRFAQMGASNDSLARTFVGLTIDDIKEAREYYSKNKREIEAAIMGAEMED